MADYYKTQGFVIKKTDQGEADQILTFYTKDFGKLDILGRGIRKIKSKLRAGTELFELSEIEFVQGKKFKTLTNVRIMEKFRNIRADLEKTQIDWKIVEAMDNLIHSPEKDKNIWILLNQIFQILNNFSPSNVHCSLLYYYFFWNLISFLGYRIDLYNCALCRRRLLPQNLYFNFKEGGIIDYDCYLKIKEGKEISPDLIKILRLFSEKNWQTLLRLKIDESFKEPLKEISENYFPYYGDIRRTTML